MKRLNNDRGFTLIELLVVIAIIGILSSVVLASLNAARGKGANAAVKSNLANMRAQAQLFYDNNSSTFGTANAGPGCNAAGSVFNDATIASAITSAQNAGGGTGICRSTTSNWVLVMPLKVTEGTYTAWCVDDSGASKGQTAANVTSITAAGTACL